MAGILAAASTTPNVASMLPSDLRVLRTELHHQSKFLSPSALALRGFLQADQLRSRSAIPPVTVASWSRHGMQAGRKQQRGDLILVSANAVTDENADVVELKQRLIDSLYGTQRGLRASSDTRAEVIELITQLEAKNPTPAPTEALTLLNGKWILAYTSYSEIFPLLATGNLPLVKVGEISQTIDSSAFTVENSVVFEGPLTTTSFSTSASFEVRSPKRVQIKFEEGIISTPKLTDSIEVPESVDVLGRTIDLTPIQGLLRPLQAAAMSVARTISGQPPLKFPIQGNRAESWLLTTFLDEDLRISRGDGGSVFVLVREASPWLY
ncbi:unnamed protein product [Sphagnum jensenii]|uniref:Plastid lipid-associated protein/fibrillin conserved domain-containing protein n=1 Tax=Sphagnum jensenii TaxID=128206 RepID=A0ABP1BRT0_9BRYO